MTNVTVDGYGTGRSLPCAVADGFVAIGSSSATAVENAIRHSGVHGVTNRIELKAGPKASDVREQIRK